MAGDDHVAPIKPSTIDAQADHVALNRVAGTPWPPGTPRPAAAVGREE